VDPKRRNVVLSVVDHRWLVAGCVSGKILKGQTNTVLHGRLHGTSAEGGGRELMRSAGFGGYGGTIITTLVAMLVQSLLKRCRFGERQEDGRSAV